VIGAVLAGVAGFLGFPVILAAINYPWTTTPRQETTP
jgi:hypothetical protein